MCGLLPPFSRVCVSVVTFYIFNNYIYSNGTQQWAVCVCAGAILHVKNKKGEEGNFCA